MRSRGDVRPGSEQDRRECLRLHAVCSRTPRRTRECARRIRRRSCTPPWDTARYRTAGRHRHRRCSGRGTRSSRTRRSRSSHSSTVVLQGSRCGSDCSLPTCRACPNQERIRRSDSPSDRPRPVESHLPRPYGRRNRSRRRRERASPSRHRGGPRRLGRRRTRRRAQPTASRSRASQADPSGIRPRRSTFVAHERVARITVVPVQPTVAVGVALVEAVAGHLKARGRRLSRRRGWLFGNVTVPEDPCASFLRGDDGRGPLLHRGDRHAARLARPIKPLGEPAFSPPTPRTVRMNRRDE
jgi:hypothetical protein